MFLVLCSSGNAATSPFLLCTGYGLSSGFEAMRGHQPEALVTSVLTRTDSALCDRLNVPSAFVDERVLRKKEKQPRTR
jgi:hypothetical protein